MYIFGEQPRLLEEQLHLHGVESQIFADQLCFHGTLTHLHGEEVALVGHRTFRYGQNYIKYKKTVQNLFELIQVLIKIVNHPYSISY